MIRSGARGGGGLVDFFIGFVLLIGLMFYYKVAVTFDILLFPRTGSVNDRWQ